MTEDARIVHCGECDRLLDESGSEPVDERKPCPACGSRARRFELHLSAKIELKTMLEGQAKPAGGGRWFVKFKHGDDLFRLTQRWHRLSRVIDRRRNRYTEHIEDAETGQVVRHVDEPLTKHTGRGSARNRSPQPPANET